jgi:hypothetical protein
MDNVMYYVSNGAQAAAPAAGMMAQPFEQGFIPGANMALMGPAAIAVLIIGALVLFGFWIWMIVHAVQNEPKDQALWILILMLTNFWGGIIYYFAVKRKMDNHLHPPHKQIL